MNSNFSLIFKIGVESDYVIRSLVDFENELSFAGTKSRLEELNLLRMQSCSISQVAYNTVESVYATLNEAARLVENAQDIKNVTLLCLVARNLFDLYANVIPIFYQDGLKSLPLVSAIVYNDFMYLAFNCLTLTHQYKSLFLRLKESQKIKSLSGSEVNEIIENFSCFDMIPKFYAAAAELLNKQIEKQQVLLLEFLNEDSNGVMDLAEGELFLVFLEIFFTKNKNLKFHFGNQF